MAAFISAFIGGILCLAFFIIWPDSYGIGLMLALFGVGLLILQKTWKRRLSLLFIFLVGILWAWICAESYWRTLLPASLVGKVVTAVGTVASIPDQQIMRQRFLFSIQQIDDHPLAQKTLAQLDWYGTNAHLQVGDKWQLLLHLKPPRGSWNDEGMDYQAWLFENHIGALGYVKNASFNRCLVPGDRSQFINAWREQLAEKIKFILQNKPLVGLVTALAVGVRDAITEDQWNVLRGTGTNHLFAIAGLHIGLVSGFIYFLMNFLWRRLGNLPLYFPAQQAATVTALLSGFIYSALAGFALPTQRAVIMLMVFLTATLLKKNISAWISWWLALGLVLIINPWEILSSSFWLSFVTVALIIYGISGRIHFSGKWRHGLHLQWIITFGLIPLSLWFFQQVSLGSLLANIIAVPWVGFVTLPLSLLGSGLLTMSFNIAVPILKCAEFTLEIIWPILTHIANLEFIQWRSYLDNPWILIAAMLGVVVLLAPRGIPARHLGVVGFLPLLFWKPPVPGAGQVWLTLFDSGSGITLVAQTQQHTLLYSNQLGNNTKKVAQKIIQPFLQARHIKNLDLLINHQIQNASYVAVKAVFKSTLTTDCQQTTNWQWDKINFTLAPAQVRGKSTGCAFWIATEKQRVLVWDDLKNTNGLKLNNDASLDVLIAQQHKADDPNQLKTLLSVFQPSIFLLATDTPVTNEPSVLDTAMLGEITTKLGVAQGVVVTNYRNAHHYFWI